MAENLSDLIEYFIKERFSEENYLELRRSEVAEHFNCVPSQINYVLSTRFSREHGYIVETKRGGGGCIRIYRVISNNKHEVSPILSVLQLSEGKLFSMHTARIVLNSLYEQDEISEKDFRMIMTAISDNALRYVDSRTRDIVRTDILRGMLLELERN